MSHRLILNRRPFFPPYCTGYRKRSNTTPPLASTTFRDATFSGSIVISTYASPSSRACCRINRSADLAYPSPVFQGTTAYPICPSTCEGRDEVPGCHLNPIDPQNSPSQSQRW